MKTYHKVLLTIALLLSTLTISAQKEKLSMWLQEKTAAMSTANSRRADGELLSCVFVRTSETLTEEMLQEYGGTIYAQLGDVSIITIPFSTLKAQV